MASESSDVPVRTAEHDAFSVIAGDCRIELDVEEHHTYRGQVLIVIKPDDTVLVHDVDGYQPVAWITRAERVVIDDELGTVTAVDGDRWLQIQVISSLVNRQLPGTVVGIPIADCPSCGGRLVDANDAVHCVSCRNKYGIPSDAELLDSRCDCGLPLMRVERGDVFTLCIDRTCDPMEAAIADRFDGTWSCPDHDCDGQLRAIRRGHLMLGCNQYPDCEISFRLPVGIVEGHCGCGLPRFHTSNGSRCLDLNCSPTA